MTWENSDDIFFSKNKEAVKEYIQYNSDLQYASTESHKEYMCVLRATHISTVVLS